MRYFEGLYFKQQNEQETIAFIPAVHVDGGGRRSASIQIITNRGSYCTEIAPDRFVIRRNGPLVRADNNLFTGSGIKIDIETEDITVKGGLRFGNLTPLHYDIMGPFRYAPLMECRHTVVSMSHTVNGTLRVNGKEMRFDDGTGYIEGDRGRSFPRRYVWTHCGFEDGALMLSAAEIPFLGTTFLGVIGAVILRGREYRLATYLGAKAVHIGDGSLTVRQGPYVLTARLMGICGTKLRAPVRGAMSRSIRENPACRAHYRLEKEGVVLLDFTSDMASFEYEYA